MEVAIIDWKNLNSRFVSDDVYEHINAPQWFDFIDPEAPIDDESRFFCKPECNHPKTVEDFYRQTPPNCKKSLGLIKRLPFAEVTGRRDSTLKKRGLASYAPMYPNDSKCDTIGLDCENKNPNFSTPLSHKSKVYKEMVKSSTEKKEQFLEKKELSRSLKSTLSARNLFGGGGDVILSKVTEFCTELKKLTLRKKDKKENTEDLVCVSDCLSDESQKFDAKVKETKPLLDHETDSKNRKALPGGNLLEKPRRKIRYVDENTPIKVDVNIIKKSEEEENVLQPIRTCPPTPQCISAIKRGPSKASPLKEIINLTAPKEQGGCQSINGRSASTTVTDKEASKGLDVFWFLKPCAISS